MTKEDIRIVESSFGWFALQVRHIKKVRRFNWLRLRFETCEVITWHPMANDGTAWILPNSPWYSMRSIRDLADTFEKLEDARAFANRMVIGDIIHTLQ